MTSRQQGSHGAVIRGCEVERGLTHKVVHDIDAVRRDRADIVSNFGIAGKECVEPASTFAILLGEPATPMTVAPRARAQRVKIEPTLPDAPRSSTVKLRNSSASVQTRWTTS
jgi:hypothetical protein